MAVTHSSANPLYVDVCSKADCDFPYAFLKTQSFAIYPEIEDLPPPKDLKKVKISG